MHTDDGDCTIVWYPTVGMKHIWQVYVTSDLKTMSFCFFYFKHHGMNFHGYGKQMLSIDCTKIGNNSKRTKTSWKSSNTTHNQQQPFTTN